MIFLSANAEEENEIRCMKGGILDYIRKPVKEDALLWRIANIMRNVEQVERLQHATEIDPMTGLFNNSYIRRVLADMCLRVSGMLMMVDLDSFKLVNDLYGHAMGDRVLIRFAEILKSVIRSTDVAGRVGGDEFLVFCRDIRGEAMVAEKTRQMNALILSSAREYMGEEMNIPLGVSVGAVQVPDEGRNFEELLRKADDALYHVKLSGKRNYFVFREGATRIEAERSQGGDSLTQLCAVLSERNRQPGAYKVSFDRFQTIFRYLVRTMENYHRPIELALFSLTAPRNGNRKARVSSEISERFSETLGASLRRSDVFAQNGNGRFLVIFTDSDGENERVIMNRILNNWKNSGYEGTVKLSYETRVVRT